MNATTYPPITELVPHRASMLLVDALLDCGETHARVLHEVRPDAWYVGDRGMPAWMGLELMAQTIAAFVGYQKRRLGLEPVQGYLLGTRRYRAAAPAFPAGSRLEIVARQQYRAASGLGAFDCEIFLDGARVAHATLTVFEPHEKD